ncbi:MAG: Na+/H+ antiporter NhaA [Bacteroidales bacterium]|nr:Na+/H+ antiporter NhaA [Bacteroidales bacterium]
MPNPSQKVVAKKLFGFINIESVSSIILIIATILALLISNSNFASLYKSLLYTPLTLQIISTIHIEPLIFWINDGLMALFFLLVGIELKREILEGHLQKWSQMALPTIAAIGGIIVPAIFYIIINWNDATTIHGWAIPSATDIAFSLAILMLLGKRVPLALKIFLMTLAIIDDLGAILIIAFFYSVDELHLSYLIIAMAILSLPKLLLHWKGIINLKLYLILGLLVWYCFLKSGIHPTIAGVALAFFIPYIGKSSQLNPLHKLEKKLQPWVAYIILPIFAFANAGVSFQGITFDSLLAPVPLGIMLGLIFGKQIGVFGFSWLLIKSGLVAMPEKVTWLGLYGVSILCGIGFTMSLFIGGLAFSNPQYMDQVRISILIASLITAAIGYLILLFAIRKC